MGEEKPKYTKDSPEVRKALAEGKELPSGTVLDFYGTESGDGGVTETVSGEPAAEGVGGDDTTTAPTTKK